MATLTNDRRHSGEIEDKAQVDMIETAYEASIDEKHVTEKVDYSGFAQKTDPQEIKVCAP